MRPRFPYSKRSLPSTFRVVGLNSYVAPLLCFDRALVSLRAITKRFRLIVASRACLHCIAITAKDFEADRPWAAESEGKTAFPRNQTIRNRSPSRSLQKHLIRLHLEPLISSATGATPACWQPAEPTQTGMEGLRNERC